MKKNITYCLLFLFAAMMMYGCKKDDDSIEFTSKRNLSVYADGVSETLTFSASLAWVATLVNDNGSDAALDWIAISPQTGDAGDATVSVSMFKNYTGSARKAKIRILCNGESYEVPVEQLATKADGTMPERNNTDMNRTVLAYVVAENSLSKYASDDIDEMKSGVASMPINNNLIVYLDDAKHNPRILRIYRNGSDVRCDTVYSYTENKCSTDPAVFEQVLNYCYNEYPAEHYGLIMWSHGAGWIPANVTQDTRWIGIDNGYNSTANTGPEMNITDMKSVLEDFISKKIKNKFDFILFDACFMQGVEVAYEFRNCTDYMIGSPTEMPGPGAPYFSLIKPFFATDFNADDVLQAYYDEYKDNPTYGVAVSAFKSSEMETLATATAQILKTLSTRVFSDNDVLYHCSRPSSTYPHYYDINSVMKKLASATDYSAWKIALDAAVPYKKNTGWVYSGLISGRWAISEDDYSGASFYIPYSTNMARWNTYFDSMEWTSASGMNTVSW